MGAYTCEYGVVHKVCRCRTPHTISCNVPEEHSVGKVDARPARDRACYRLRGNLLGKHEVHESHSYWNTWQGEVLENPNNLSSGNSIIYPRWICPGRND